ncbi:hypothetical protein PVK06_026406 [Gossypium arboreum]|uniref:Uncharacterized protein n=1 Tax=Gossypium arboreum TaxID=29729 RepID=A0ABR0NXK6_GOSAR|nr:hypothetical protein PVK06_026406 [Gossypium arboreum]
MRLELEVVTSSHCSSDNAIVELYVEFSKVDGAGPSLTTVAQLMQEPKQKVLYTVVQSNEGTSNPLFEAKNEDATEEEDAVEEEVAANFVNGSKLDADPIR